MMQSRTLYTQALSCIPGGVNSPVRAFNGVGGQPVFIKKGQGAYLFDADDKKYIDYIGSWGALLAGHAHPYIVEKVMGVLQNGLSFGAPTEMEVQLAEKITQLMPSIEMVRFVSSGTEATMSAIRLARGFTRRNKIIKFSGCYHGHSDSLLVSAGSGALTLGIPSSAGVPESIIQHTLVANYNDLQSVADLFAHYGKDIAGVIVEPVAGNMNCILPAPGFLQGLRDLCDQYGSLLIFDEVMTGFRVALGGAQALYNIKPDLTTLGKIIGGGMPVGAFGGRKDVMHAIAPLGPVYQAGTLSGNPVAMTAGLAQLEVITQPGVYSKLETQTKKLIAGLNASAKITNTSFMAHSVGSMFGVFFVEDNIPESEADLKRCNVELFKKFFHAMLAEGVYLAPSAFEAGFVSSVHEDQEIEQTLAAAQKVFAELKSGI